MLSKYMNPLSESYSLIEIQFNIIDCRSRSIHSLSSPINCKFIFITTLLLDNNLLVSLQGIQQFRNLQNFSLNFNFIKEKSDILRIKNAFLMKKLSFIGNQIQKYVKIQWLVNNGFRNIQQINDVSEIGRIQPQEYNQKNNQQQNYNNNERNNIINQMSKRQTGKIYYVPLYKHHTNKSTYDITHNKNNSIIVNQHDNIQTKRRQPSQIDKPVHAHATLIINKSNKNKNMNLNTNTNKANTQLNNTITFSNNNTKQKHINSTAIQTSPPTSQQQYHEISKLFTNSSSAKKTINNYAHSFYPYSSTQQQQYQRNYQHQHNYAQNNKKNTLKINMNKIVKPFQIYPFEETNQTDQYINESKNYGSIKKRQQKSINHNHINNYNNRHHINNHNNHNHINNYNNNNNPNDKSIKKTGRFIIQSENINKYKSISSSLQIHQHSQIHSLIDEQKHSIAKAFYYRTLIQKTFSILKNNEENSLQDQNSYENEYQNKKYPQTTYNNKKYSSTTFRQKYQKLRWAWVKLRLNDSRKKILQNYKSWGIQQYIESQSLKHSSQQQDQSNKSVRKRMMIQ